MKHGIVLIALITLILLSGCVTDDPGNDISASKDGLSYETAVLIESNNLNEILLQELSFLQKHECTDSDRIQTYESNKIVQKDGVWYDITSIECSNGKKEEYHFQINKFFESFLKRQEQSGRYGSTPETAHVIEGTTYENMQHQREISVLANACLDKNGIKEVNSTYVIREQMIYAEGAEFVFDTKLVVCNNNQGELHYLVIGAI